MTPSLPQTVMRLDIGEYTLASLIGLLLLLFGDAIIQLRKGKPTDTDLMSLLGVLAVGGLLAAVYSIEWVIAYCLRKGG